MIDENRLFLTISVSKGIAILLMVVGHSGCPIWLHNYIYMFHMPFFFFISGYCFKEKYLFNFSQFFSRKVKGIYFPYVLIGISFLLLRNEFTLIGLYNNHDIPMLDNMNVFVLIIKEILLLNHAEPLIGGFWFLKYLFWGNLFFYLSLRLSKKDLIAFLVLCLITVLTMFYNLGIPYLWIGFYDFYSVLFIFGGYLFRKYTLLSLSDWYRNLSLLACLIITAYGSFHYSTEFLKVQISNVIPYTISAFAGCYMLIVFSDILVRYFRNIMTLFELLGNHTLLILTWHFLGFKFASLIYILLKDCKYSYLSEFPVIGDSQLGSWWLLYTLIGITFPLFLLKLHNLFKIKMKQVHG